MDGADAYKNLSVEDLAMLCAFKDDTIEVLQRNLEYHMDKTKPKEVATYVDVDFGDHTHYTYLTGGLDLAVGDTVIVPVGRHHHERPAVVVAKHNSVINNTIVYKTVHRKDTINV